MNILMVDDDKYVLEGLRNGLDWSRLPFENRYEARNVAEAKKIIGEITIHVLLCDIDMPQESGLDLLEWLRNQNSTLQVVFLTSYADFNYAKRALKLGSFDYFLKPIEFDRLTQILIDASCKAEELDDYKTFQKYGKYWLESERQRQETFWQKLLHLSNPTPEEISLLAKEQKTDYQNSGQFVLMAFQVKQNASKNWRDDDMFYYQLQSIVHDRELKNDTPLVQDMALWQENSTLWYGIFQISGNRNEYWKQLSKVASTVRKHLKHDFSEFAVYLSQEASLCQIQEQVLKIRLMMFNNISYGNGIFFVVDYHPAGEKPVLPDKKQIDIWLMQQNTAALNVYLNQIIHSIAAHDSNPLTASRSLIAEWTQIIFLYLDKNQVNASNLFSNDNYKALYKNSVNNFSECQTYLQALTTEAIEFVKQTQQSRQLISQVEEYIRSHLSENMTRSSLGEFFCLNPDYLANTFKKTTGISLIRYINDCRLEKARTLLLTSEEPIYSISISVGYPNSSYFTKQFRKRFNCGPSDLRNESYLLL